MKCAYQEPATRHFSRTLASRRAGRARGEEVEGGRVPDRRHAGTTGPRSRDVCVRHLTHSFLQREMRPTATTSHALRGRVIFGNVAAGYGTHGACQG